MIFNQEKFIENYIAVFGRTIPERRRGIETLLSFFAKHVLFSQPQVAYIFATVKHECADTWLPIVERGGREYFIRRYWDNKKIRSQLELEKPEDAVRYCGRGYCMITGPRNYRLMSRHVGHDLIAHPELALDPEISFRILSIGMSKGLFTGKKLSEYIPYSGEPDYYGARRVINGVDRASLIADYAVKINGILSIARE